jgi:hypothetical protein
MTSEPRERVERRFAAILVTRVTVIRERCPLRLRWPLWDRKPTCKLRQLPFLVSDRAEDAAANASAGG